MEDSNWKPEFKTWHKVSIESYRLINAEAKERMEEVLSESESITNKSIKFIAAIIAVSSFFLKLFIDSEIPISQYYWILMFFIIPTFVFCYLIFPKTIYRRGFEPKEFIPADLDNDTDKEYQEQIIYYNSISNLQRNISKMNTENNCRIHLYKLGFFLTLFMFLIYSFTYVLLLPPLS